MSAAKKLKRRHRGALRTKRRVTYVEDALGAALADPEMRPHVGSLGDLFPRRRGQKVAPKQLTRALAARHPTNGKLLRKRVNRGVRQEGDSLVSNVCFGFDIPLAVDKSVTIAALVFKDTLVLNAAMDAMRRSAGWLSKRMDRRLRRGGQCGTLATGKSSIFFIPEKAGRDGQPHLHAHLVIPNLTSFEEDGRTHHCAGHFRRIARSAMEAQQRTNRQLSRSLKKAGYATELVDGVCRLTSVPRALCAELSPVSARLKPENEGGRRRSTKAAVRFRENCYLKTRPGKVLQPLAHWQSSWEQSIGADRLAAEARAYHTGRYHNPVGPNKAPAEVIPFPPDIAAPAPVAAALRIEEPHDDVLDDAAMVRPNFASLGMAVRKRAERELGGEARRQVIELDYVCTDKARHMVEHTEALRTLLRLIFPRLLVHQRFAAAEQSSFRVTGAVAANPPLAQLVVATAAALEAELGHEAVRANWPTVLRSLHEELANRFPEPVRAPRTPAGVRRVRPAKPLPQVRKETAVKPSVVGPPPPPPAPSPATGPEWDLMP